MAKSSINRKFSRYTQGGTTVNFGQRLGWWERQVFTQSDDDITLTLSTKYAGRPDLISYDYYGKAELMWLVLQYNNIVDLEEELIEGQTIRLPSPQRVLFELLNKPIGGITPAEDELG